MVCLVGIMHTSTAFCQSVLRGTVVDFETDKVISNVNVLDLHSGFNTKTDSLGRFEIVSNESVFQFSLQFSKIGYQSLQDEYLVADKTIVIKLIPSPIDLEEVEINTGYQWIPKERATGSFVHIDQKQLEMIPGNSILKKLDGIMPGLYFDNRNSGPLSNGESDILVRGLNTFGRGSTPLIVVDNFPFDGDLETINPEDVASVTMLRDAAATSIWGARAGNGVIVINIKKPKGYNHFALSGSSNVTITPKPDLYYQPSMSSSEFVDVELFLYGQNYYRSALIGSNAYRTVFSPVVQALYDNERGLINQEQLDRIIADARKGDFRNQLLDYYYRNIVRQQHHFSISKSTNNHRFRFSFGVNKANGLNNQNIGEHSDIRYSFNLFNSYQLTKQLSVDFDLRYSIYQDKNVTGMNYPFNPGGGKTAMYPYARLIDDDGQLLSLPKGLNSNFVDTVGRGNLMDWRYYPLEDQKYVSNNSYTNTIQPTLKLRYNPVGSLQFEAIYGADLQLNKSNTHYDVQSFEVRDQVNRFTRIEGEQIFHPFPMGDMLLNGLTDHYSQKLRFNAKMDEAFFENHRITWIMGGELSDYRNNRRNQRVYGYDPFMATSIPVDHVYRYPLFLGGTGAISNGQSFGFHVRKLVSFYANASYILKNKYILSASGRQDASNVFGAKANERWNPLWSVGLAWDLQKEVLIQDLDWISELKLRFTHGHGGNLGGGTTSDRVVVSKIANASYTGLPAMIITDPPNLSLKWENVEMNNIAVDFGFWKGKLNGSIEYYRKKVTDLISRDPIDRTTGYSFMDRNVGNIDGEGLDIFLNLDPFKGPFRWKIGTSFSYRSDWVTKYNGGSFSTAIFASGDNTARPMVGKVLMPVYSYRFAGLDPENGDPLGYLNGEISKNYTAISRDSLSNLIYHGSARPLFHGFVNHTIEYRNFSLFLNFSFRGGHYFKHNTISYSGLFAQWQTHSDYSKRWQQPGDEKVTTIPSMVYPANSTRDSFYANSEANVARGDVIRLDQLRLNYRWNRSFWKIKSIEAGMHISNLGIVWKASKRDRDPDYFSIPPSRLMSANIRIQF